MVVLRSSKLPLPSSSSTQINSFLFEPNSHSLALIHSDSSISVFPSLSFPSFPSKQTLIPSPSSSSSFVLLQHNNQDNPTVLFLVSAPYLGGSQILFRFFILQKNHVFSKINQVVCSQKGFKFEPKFGVLMDENHGVCLKIVGSINFFAMYSVSSRKVWVFGLKLVDNDNGDNVVKLMKCAIIDCCVPVWSISVDFGLLIFGEDKGARVFNLRQLVKGNVKKVKSLNSNSDYSYGKLKNGMIGSDHHSIPAACNGFMDGKSDKHHVSVKQKSVRFRQDSGIAGACFVAFEGKEVGESKSIVKAVSIQALSPQKFMILDSNGGLHILGPSNSVGGSNIKFQMMHIPHSMKVAKLAVLPDISSRVHNFWISDGLHSVHVMMASEIDIAANKNDGDENQEKLMQISVVQAIFAGEKIQDLVPMGANGLLILGQANIYAYVMP